MSAPTAIHIQEVCNAVTLFNAEENESILRVQKFDNISAAERRVLKAKIQAHIEDLNEITTALTRLTWEALSKNDVNILDGTLRQVHNKVSSISMHYADLIAFNTAKGPYKAIVQVLITAIQDALETVEDVRRRFFRTVDDARAIALNKRLSALD